MLTHINCLFFLLSCNYIHPRLSLIHVFTKWQLFSISFRTLLSFAIKILDLFTALYFFISRVSDPTDLFSNTLSFRAALLFRSEIMLDIWVLPLFLIFRNISFNIERVLCFLVGSGLVDKLQDMLNTFISFVSDNAGIVEGGGTFLFYSERFWWIFMFVSAFATVFTQNWSRFFSLLLK